MNYIKEIKAVDKEQKQYQSIIQKKFDEIKEALVNELKENYIGKEKILSTKPLCYVLSFNDMVSNGFKDRYGKVDVRFSPQYNSCLLQIEDFMRYFDRFRNNNFQKNWNKSIQNGMYVYYDENNKVQYCNRMGLHCIYMNQQLINAVNKILFNKE